MPIFGTKIPIFDYFLVHSRLIFKPLWSLKRRYNLRILLHWFVRSNQFEKPICLWCAKPQDAYLKHLPFIRIPGQNQLLHFKFVVLWFYHFELKFLVLRVLGKKNKIFEFSRQTKIHILFLLLESEYLGNKDFWRENSKYFYFETFWILFLKIGAISKRWSVDRKTKILLLQIVVGGLTNSNFALFAPGRAAYHSDSLRSCFYEFHPHAIVLLVLIWTNVDEIWDFHQEGKLLKGLLVGPF